MNTFSLSKSELEAAKLFIKEQNKKAPANAGAIGGRWSYQFTPTSIGVISSIVDNVTKETKDLTDFDNW